MRKLKTGSLFCALAATAFLSGCASSGGFDETMSKFGSSVGTIVGEAGKVAKNVGGALVPKDYVTGVHVSDEQLASLKSGMTTSEVAAVIGRAPDVSEVKGGEMWSYPFTRIPHFGENVQETTVVRFDDKGRMVEAYKSKGVKGGTGNPLLDAASAKGYL